MAPFGVWVDSIEPSSAVAKDARNVPHHAIAAGRRYIRTASTSNANGTEGTGPARGPLRSIVVDVLIDRRNFSAYLTSLSLIHI